MVKKKSKVGKLFQIVIPKSCPHCGKRALTKKDGKIFCKKCKTGIETEVENKFWFYSSQDKSILLDLKKEIIRKQRSVKNRLLELRNIRKIL